jgi:hypothetical protein
MKEIRPDWFPPPKSPLDERWKITCGVCGCDYDDMVKRQTIHSSVPISPMDICLDVCGHHTEKEIDEAINGIYEKRKAAALANPNHPQHQQLKDKEGN